MDLQSVKRRSDTRPDMRVKKLIVLDNSFGREGAGIRLKNLLYSFLGTLSRQLFYDETREISQRHPVYHNCTFARPIICEVSYRTLRELTIFNWN